MRKRRTPFIRNVSLHCGDTRNRSGDRFRSAQLRSSLVGPLGNFTSAILQRLASEGDSRGSAPVGYEKEDRLIMLPFICPHCGGKKARELNTGCFGCTFECRNVIIFLNSSPCLFDILRRMKSGSKPALKPTPPLSKVASWICGSVFPSPGRRPEYHVPGEPCAIAFSPQRMEGRRGSRIHRPPEPPGRIVFAKNG